MTCSSEVFSRFQSEVSSSKSDNIYSDEIENKVLFSPKVENRADRSEKKKDFDAEFMILNTAKLQPKLIKDQACHLLPAQENNILFNQSEEPIISNRQVSNEYKITNSNGQITSKIGTKIDHFRQKSSKNPKNPNSGEVPRGGVPLLEPKIERHSQEIVSTNKGPTPPLEPNIMGLKDRLCSDNSNFPNKKEKSTGKKLQGKKKIVTKKISPKSDKKKPELRLMFERIKQKKENIAAQKERKIKLEDKKEKENLGTENSSGPNVKKIISDYEENSRKLSSIHTPSKKFQFKSKADAMKRIEVPINKHAASPKNRQKINPRKVEKIIEKFSENSDLTRTDDKTFLLMQKDKKVRTFQRTIWDSWG